jgi:hypothetical protein
MASRRHLLALASILAVPSSGCLTRLSGKKAVELHSIVIRNDDRERHTIAVQINEDENEVFQEVYDLEPKTGEELDNIVSVPGEYTVSASFEGSSYSRDLTAAIDDDDSCIRVTWQITLGGMLASEVHSYTQCS